MSSELAARYQQIMRRIGSLAGGPGRVTLVAVSKSQPVEAIEALHSLGHRDFGENYAQEMIEKASVLESKGCSGIRWHFIGHLQTNKVKSLAPSLAAVHSVDSEKLALELNKRWTDTHPGGERLPCFLEINIDNEPSKAGAPPDSAPALAASIARQCPGLELQGLMAIPSADGSLDQRTRSFAALKALEARCHPYTAGRLSMGMSDDFEIAIAQGATHVRVGTALFGARK